MTSHFPLQVLPVFFHYLIQLKCRAPKKYVKTKLNLFLTSLPFGDHCVKPVENLIWLSIFHLIKFLLFSIVLLNIRVQKLHPSEREKKRRFSSTLFFCFHLFIFFLFTLLSWNSKIFIYFRAAEKAVVAWEGHHRERERGSLHAGIHQ